MSIFTGYFLKPSYLLAFLMVLALAASSASALEKLTDSRLSMITGKGSVPDLAKRVVLVRYYRQDRYYFHRGTVFDRALDVRPRTRLKRSS